MSRDARKRPPGVGNPFEEEPVTDVAQVEVTSPVRIRRPPVLRLLQADGSSQNHVLTLDRMVIGRGSQADISVDARDISRRHALVERVGDEFRCTDLDSTHGLFLNGVRVHSCLLRPGDALQLGSVTFVFDEPDA